MGMQGTYSGGGVERVPSILMSMNQTWGASQKKKKKPNQTVVLPHLLSSLHTHLLQSHEREHRLCNVKASGNTSFTR